MTVCMTMSMCMYSAYTRMFPSAVRLPSFANSSSLFICPQFVESDCGLP